MCRIGVLISAYFAEPYLEGRLDNLAAQALDLASLDIAVICQDGSEEERIAERWIEEHIKAGRAFPAVQIINTPDVPTVYGAWNLGILNLPGVDYLTNANADDRLDPDGLAALVQALEDHPVAALAFGNLRTVTAPGGPQVGMIACTESRFEDLLRQCTVGPCPVWRRALHDTYGLFDESLQVAGDYDFWLRIASGGETFVHVDRIVGEYLYRPDSREHREPVRAIWEGARVRARYRKEPYEDAFVRNSEPA